MRLCPGYRNRCSYFRSVRCAWNTTPVFISRKNDYWNSVPGEPSDGDNPGTREIGFVTAWRHEHCDDIVFREAFGRRL